MIVLENVTKLYNEGRPNEVAAVKGVSLDIAGGAVTVLKGPSGSGKTTLLSVLGCMARPTSGRVTLGGEPVSGLPERFLTAERRTRFGFVFQRFNLIRGLTVIENVVLPTAPMGEDFAVVRARAEARLDDLGLAGKADMKVENLSGGETQRVAIARALVNNAPVFIADEPTANLDSALAERFLEIVTRLKNEGRTIVITSHDPRIWEAPVVDAVVSMRDGRVVE